MFEGQTKALSSTELSYDDFLETYGRVRSGSFSCSKSEAFEGNITSCSSLSNCDGDKINQVDSDCARQDNGTCIEERETNKEENRVDVLKEMDRLEEYTPETRRRNSKLSNMATRLARKSFRMVKKKSLLEDTPTDLQRSKSRPSTPVKWNKLFKRNQTYATSSTERHATSSLTGKEQQSYCATPQGTPSLPHVRPILARSASQVTPSSFQLTPNTAKRLSLDSHRPKTDKTSTSKEQETFEKNIRRTSKINSNAKQNSENCPHILPSLDSQSRTLECEVMKKYDEVRQEEEMRIVAIVTLLKRRKNSLKIKCDQFDKDLEEGALHVSHTDIVAARLEQMRRKLKVVERCIEEQTEAMKINFAKLDLQQSLELYQLDLLREDKSGYSFYTSRRRKKKNKCYSKSQLFASASCETLESVNENCSLDDSSSVASLEQKDGPSAAPLSLSERLSSSTYECFSKPPSGQREQFASTDELAQDVVVPGRSRSIDYAITSDCDSGFDNGENLCRSDVSLNRSFSKSTGSIASSSSRGTASRSGSAFESSSSQDFTEHQYFFSPSPSSSEQSIYKSRHSSNRSTKPHRRSKHEVDSSTLAAIEDFEKFAERTQRRLTNRGKLVPLKKGS